MSKEKKESKKDGEPFFSNQEKIKPEIDDEVVALMKSFQKKFFYGGDMFRPICRMGGNIKCLSVTEISVLVLHRLYSRNMRLSAKRINVQIHEGILQFGHVNWDEMLKSCDCNHGLKDYIQWVNGKSLGFPRAMRWLEPLVGDGRKLYFLENDNGKESRSEREDWTFVYNLWKLLCENHQEIFKLKEKSDDDECERVFKNTHHLL